MEKIKKCRDVCKSGGIVNRRSHDLCMRVQSMGLGTEGGGENHYN